MKKARFLIIVVVALAFFGWQLFATFGESGLSEKEKATLKTEGVKCTAILTAVERTGTTVNNIHQYACSFDIKMDSAQNFPYREKKLIDPIYMSSIQIGMSIPAYVSRDKKDIWVVWEDVGVKDAF